MRIVIFGYGSVIKHHSSNYYNNCLYSSEFKDSGLLIPLSFSRLSSANNPLKSRLTVVIDKKGINCPLYYSIHDYNNLNNAINNIKEREGLSTNITSNDHNISYIRKGLPNNHSKKQNLLKVIINNEQYSGRWKNLSNNKVKEIILWLINNNFDACIITEFDCNIDSKQRIEYLKQPDIYSRTLQYYNDLPEYSQKQLHSQIIT